MFDKIELHITQGGGEGNGRDAARGNVGGRAGKYPDSDGVADGSRREDDAAVVPSGDGGS